MSVLIIAVTDNEVMYISVDKKYRNLSIRDSQLCDADKNVTERTLCHTKYAIQNRNIFVFILIFVEKTQYNKHCVVLLR